MASSDWGNWQCVCCKQFSVGRLCLHSVLGYVHCVVYLFGFLFFGCELVVMLSDVNGFVSFIWFGLVLGMVICDVDMDVCWGLVLGRRIGGDVVTY